jgi:hypothetical protein
VRCGAVISVFTQRLGKVAQELFRKKKKNKKKRKLVDLGDVTKEEHWLEIGDDSTWWQRQRWKTDPLTAMHTCFYSSEFTFNL